MRKPTRIEWLYADFDGFFASVEQQARPALRGRPVAIIPFEDERRSICIAVSKEAKALGVRTGTPCPDARRLAPGIVFIQQRPPLYVRAHHALIGAIERCLPVTAPFSIDELAASVAHIAPDQLDTLGLAIKSEIRALAPYITISIGMAANPHLAKIACKWNKPDGLTLFHPQDMPGRLLAEDRADIPGIGKRIAARLDEAGLHDMQAVWHSQPKQLRAIWGSVAGERFWYALHGYDVPGEPTQRSMYGHGRVLPPSHRSVAQAGDYAAFLLAKAARRMRADGYASARIDAYAAARGRSWSAGKPIIPPAHDDRTFQLALRSLWSDAARNLARHAPVYRIGVTLSELARGPRQLDLFSQDPERPKWEAVTEAADAINRKYYKNLVTVGALTPPPGAYTGSKIAFTRIPDFEDFA